MMCCITILNTADAQKQNSSCVPPDKGFATRPVTLADKMLGLSKYRTNIRDVIKRQGPPTETQKIKLPAIGYDSEYLILYRWVVPYKRVDDNGKYFCKQELFANEKGQIKDIVDNWYHDCPERIKNYCETMDIVHKVPRPVLSVMTKVQIKRVDSGLRHMGEMQKPYNR